MKKRLLLTVILLSLNLTLFYKINHVESPPKARLLFNEIFSDKNVDVDLYGWKRLFVNKGDTVTIIPFKCEENHTHYEISDLSWNEGTPNAWPATVLN